MHLLHKVISIVKKKANKYKYDYRRIILRTFKNTRDPEIQEILMYLKKHELTYFNYEWFSEKNMNFKIMQDERGRYFYLYNNHRMYFKKSWGKERIASYLKNLIPEQDPRSPHLYFAENEMKDHYKCVVDAGVAEGMFALTIIDRADQIYLVECDGEWIEALEQTFSPFKDKVCIIPKRLGMDNTDTSCSLDHLLRDTDSLDLLKLDIEGAELSALEGGYNIIPNTDCMLICVYHYQDEEHDVRKYINELNNCKFEITMRKGYVFFLHDANQKYPYLRRGCMKIERKSINKFN